MIKEPTISKMETLTEQWKNGELDVLFDVYVKIPDEDIRIRKIYYLNQYLGTKLSDEIEILAPVPTYEEWEELQESNDGLSKLMFKSLMDRFVKADEERERLEEENSELVQKIHILNEVVEECRKYIETEQKILVKCPPHYKKLMEELLTKIDEALR